MIGSSVAPPSIDSTSNAAAAIDEVFDDNIYQHLAQLSPNGKIVPVLATSWNVSKTGTIYSFTLRRGVTFSNGDPLTASDVVYSNGEVLDPGAQGGQGGVPLLLGTRRRDLGAAKRPDRHPRQSAGPRERAIAHVCGRGLPDDDLRPGRADEGAFSVAKTNLVREPVALPGPARTLLPTLAEHVRDEA